MIEFVKINNRLECSIINETSQKFTQEKLAKHQSVSLKQGLEKKKKKSLILGFI